MNIKTENANKQNSQWENHRHDNDDNEIIYKWQTKKHRIKWLKCHKRKKSKQKKINKRNQRQNFELNFWNDNDDYYYHDHIWNDNIVDTHIEFWEKKDLSRMFTQCNKFWS